MLTPGTALVPHFLWSDKPSVLLGECYAKQGYTFIYKDLCFSEIDINRVIVMIRSQNTLKDKKIFNKLNKLFECGVSSELYEQFLEDKIKLIMDASKTNNINTLT